MHVGDHMTRDVITLTPGESCARARAVMAAAGIGRLLIVDHTRLVGIVTDGDLLRRTPFAPEALDPKESQDLLSPHVKICGVMTYAPVTSGPLLTIEEAVALMLERRINTLPIVEGQRLVGILTMGDVHRAGVLPSQQRPSG